MRICDVFRNERRRGVEYAVHALDALVKGVLVEQVGFVECQCLTKRRLWQLGEARIACGVGERANGGVHMVATLEKLRDKLAREVAGRTGDTGSEPRRGRHIHHGSAREI